MGSMDKIMDGVLSTYLIAFAGIASVVALATANTTGLPAGVSTLVTTVMPIVIIFGLVYVAYSSFKGSKGKGRR